MEVAVNDLVAITGKTKEQCTLALTAARGNPDVAYEILSSGMGGGDQNEFDDDYGGEDEEGSANPGAGGNPFAALASNPNFALIR